MAAAKRTADEVGQICGVGTDIIQPPRKRRDLGTLDSEDDLEASGSSGIKPARAHSVHLATSPPNTTNMMNASQGTTNPVHFRFLDLPPELRLHVYHAALQRPGHLELHPPQSSGSERLPPQSAGINTALLRTCKQINKEAMPVLYSSNTFKFTLSNGRAGLDSLRQPTRSLIKNIYVAIPDPHDTVNGFAELVRLGLRYCWGLKKCIIAAEWTLPTPESGERLDPHELFAEGFNILRWLPKDCNVVLDGTIDGRVAQVVAKEKKFQRSLEQVRDFWRWYWLEAQVAKTLTVPISQETASSANSVFEGITASVGRSTNDDGFSTGVDA